MQAPIKIRTFALFSGGKDSITLVDNLAKQDMLIGCLSFDTGISIPEWRDFIESTCRKNCWPLTIIKTPINYDDLVLKFGFPGPGLHYLFMNYLKGRCLAQFRKENPGVLVASGVRKTESKRRFKNTKEWSIMEGCPIWAPLYNWTTEEVIKYVVDNKLQKSPCYYTIGISGDCLCGAFARENERQLIEEYYPELHVRLCNLEKRTNKKWGSNKQCKKGRKNKSESIICVECINNKT